MQHITITENNNIISIGGYMHAVAADLEISAKHEHQRQAEAAA